MSSLLQFDGEVDERGVGLLFYATDNGKCYGKDLETLPCARCEGIGEYPTPSSPPGAPSQTNTVCEVCHGRPNQSVLYRAFRKPAGMFGPWVLFRYLGETHAPDLSVPIAVPEIPRGAVRLADSEIRAYWAS